MGTSAVALATVGLLGMLAGATASSPPAGCTAAMDAFCSGPAMLSCNAKIRRLNGTLPTIALNDIARTGNGSAWRCYSPSCLEEGPGGWAYRRGSGCSLYCSEGPALEKVLNQCLHPQPTPPPHPAPTGREISVNATDVWGSLAARCGQIRTPELIRTPKNMILIGQCRVAPKGGGGGEELPAAPLGDDMRDVMLVQVTSTDDGASWGAPKFISAVGRSVGVGVYDRVLDTVVLQYQSFLSSNPYTGNSLWQRVSKDHGATWGPERNISGDIAACNGGGGGQVCGAAGSRLQSSSGRIVFSGHNGKGGGVCVWYSDDGGETYTVSASGIFPGNEQSIADLGNGTLYMNGRGTSFPFAGSRASYWSHDDGSTWGAGQIAANLTEPNAFGCDGAVVAVPNKRGAAGPPRLFFSEPAGPGERVSYRVWCSTDGGLTWPTYVGINRGDVAGYSALENVAVGDDGTQQILAVWEQRPTMLAHVLPIDDWCPAS